MRCIFKIGSVFSGGSTSILYISVQNEIKNYFDGRAKAMAVSFTLFGIGVGGMCWPYISSSLVNEYGLRGTFLIYSGIFANCIPLSAMIAPPRTIKGKEVGKNTKDKTKSEHEQVEQEVNTKTKEKTKTEQAEQVVERQQHGVKNEQNVTEVKITEQENNSCSKNIILKDFCLLLSNASFVIITIVIMLSIGLWASIKAIAMDRIVEMNYQRSKGVLLFLVINMVNSFSRFIPPALKLIPKMSIFGIPCIFTLMSGLCLVYIPVVRDYMLMSTLFGISLGVAPGVIRVVFPLITLKLVDSRLFAIALGMSQTVQGVSSIIASSIVGRYCIVSYLVSSRGLAYPWRRESSLLCCILNKRP